MPSSPVPSRRARRTTASRRIVAGVAAATLAGAVVTAIAGPVQADVAGVCTAGQQVNPMGVATPTGSAYGYAVWASGDVLLDNSELEGSLAVGGTLTVGQTLQGDYPVVHSIAGNAQYGLPIVDGHVSRVLVNAYTPGPGPVRALKVKTEGSAGVTGFGDLDGYVAVVDMSTPSGFEVRGGYTSGTNAAFWAGDTSAWGALNGNQRPGIESFTQTLAQSSTLQAEQGFLDYFGPDGGTALLAQTGVWLTPTLPSDQNAAVVLAPGGANRTTLTALRAVYGSIGKFEISGYGATGASLIVKVDPSDVVGGVLTVPSVAQASTAGDMASYVLWDLSDVTGTVTLRTPNEPVRGAVYAPGAHVVIDDLEFEGQVVARDFSATAAGKEVHTSLFLGKVPCTSGPTAPVTGGLRLTKTVAGDAGASPAVTVFSGTWTCSAAGDDGASGTWTLADGGLLVLDGFPEGTTCTVTEDPVGAVNGSWVSSLGTGATLTTGAGLADVAVVNTFTIDPGLQVRGGFRVTKTVAGDTGWTPAVPSFSGTWTCDAPGTAGTSGTWDLPAGGSVTLDGFLVGTTCTVREDAVAATNGVWSSSLGVAGAGLTVAPGVQDVAVVNTFTATVVTPAPTPSVTTPAPTTPAPTTTAPAGGSGDPGAAAVDAQDDGTSAGGGVLAVTGAPGPALAAAALVLLTAGGLLVATRARRPVRVRR